MGDWRLWRGFWNRRSARAIALRRKRRGRLNRVFGIMGCFHLSRTPLSVPEGRFFPHLFIICHPFRLNHWGWVAFFSTDQNPRPFSLSTINSDSFCQCRNLIYKAV
jgi:hypothetical protein